MEHPTPAIDRPMLLYDAPTDPGSAAIRSGI